MWPKATYHGVFCRQEVTWFPRGPAAPLASATNAQEHPSMHMVAAGIDPPMGRTQAVQQVLGKESFCCVPIPVHHWEGDT